MKKLPVLSILVIVVILLGAAMRFYKLDSYEYRLDELDGVYRASVMTFKDTLTFSYRGANASSSIPPLYILLLKVWVSIFGESEIATRMLSVFLSALSMLFFFKLIGLFTRKSRSILFGLLLFSFNFHMIMFSRMTRRYSLLVLLAIASFYLFSLVFIKKRTSRLSTISYILLSAIGVYTDYLFVLILLSQGIIILFRQGNLSEWLACQLAIFCLFLPWLVQIIFKKWLIHEIVLSINWIPKLTLDAFIGNIPALLMGTNAVSILFVIFLLILAIFILVKKRNEAAAFIVPSFVPLMTLALVSIIHSLLNIDYLLVSIPFLIILITLGFENFRFIASFVFIVLLLGNLAQIGPLFEQNRPYSTILSSIQSPNSVILPYPTYYTTVICFYAPLSCLAGSYHGGEEWIRQKLFSSPDSWLIFTNISSKPDVLHSCDFFLRGNSSKLVERKNMGPITLLHFVS